MSSETRCTLKGATIIEVDPTGSHCQVNIPGVGKRRINQSGVHDDSEVYWSVKQGKKTVEAGPGKLVLNGWYAEKIGLELD